MNKKISELDALTSFQNSDSLPILDSSDGSTKKVQLEDLIKFFDGSRVGDVKMSLLDPTQFSSTHSGTWLLMNGQSCLGTSYASLTGNSNVRDAFSEGAFFRQAKSGRNLGSFEYDANKSHQHDFVFNRAAAVPVGSTPYQVLGSSNANVLEVRSAGDRTVVNSIISSGDTESRPKNIAVNYYLKVDYV